MLKTSTTLTTDSVRISSPNTTQLAVDISNLVWPEKNVFWKPGAIILLPENRWRDAIVGVPLMHHPNNAAILLTRTNSLPDATRKEIQRLDPSGFGVHGEHLLAQVFVVGPIESSVIRAVNKLGYSTKAIKGQNTLETSVAVAMEMAMHMPNPPIVVVPYHSPEDSQPVMSLVAHGGASILFANNDNIPTATKNALKEIEPGAVYIISRNSKLAPTITEQIQELIPDSRVIRIGGNSLTELSIHIAKFLDPVNHFGWGRLEPEGDVFTFVASGSIYESIFSATLAHLATHAPELIIPSNQELPQVLRDYLLKLNPPMTKPPRPPFMRAWIIGGEKNITTRQQIEIETLIIKEQKDWPPMH